MFVQDIERLGLTEKEAKIYLTSLRIGPASMQVLARKANIDRGTAYHVVMTLGEKGLFDEIKENKKTLYRAAQPSRLYSYVEEQKHLADQHFQIMQSMVQDLEDLYNLVH
jgi:sugar-specific transcriptional regulator TrmB